MSKEFDFRPVIKDGAAERELRRAAEDKDVIDLDPRQYRSSRKSTGREPIFGSGALPFVGELLGLAFTLCLLIGIVYLGSHFKGMLFGEKAEKPAISEGVTSNGVRWKVTE